MFIERRAGFTPRSIDISDEERGAAKDAIARFDAFLKSLWATGQQSERLSAVLEKAPDTGPERLFAIRHLLRRFQTEVREAWRKAIPSFNAALEALAPLANDTEISKTKDALVGAMSELAEVAEHYLETFEDFNDPDQVKTLLADSKRMARLSASVEAVVDSQLKPHLERDVLRKRADALSARIERRKRLVRMAGGYPWRL